MKTVKEVTRQVEAACLRHRMRAERRRCGHSTDLKTVIAEYRQYNLEYADKLERLLYPEPQNVGRERHAGRHKAG